MARKPDWKKCACGCGKWLRPKGKRIYATRQCRDRVSQAAFRERNRLARKVSEGLAPRKMKEMRIP